MRVTVVNLVVIATALAVPQIAHASDDDEEEVLVRGGRSFSSPSSSSGSGAFVSRATIEDSPREITDAASLVEPLPGVHVRRLGADDSFATLSIRGSSSTQVAVYLAGVPLSGGADPTLDLATLPLWPLAQAKVFRSFAPASLGRGSLGGTLSIDPPSPRSTSTPQTDVWIAGGSFGSRRLRMGDVRTLSSSSGIQIATGLSASRSDDNFPFLDAPKAEAAGVDLFQIRRNAGHEAVAGLVSVGVPIRIGGKIGAITFTELAQARRQQLPGPASSTPTPFQALESNRLVSAMNLSVAATDRSTASVRAWGRREGLSLRDQPAFALANGGLPISTNDAIIAVGGSGGWKTRPTDSSSIEARLDGSGERFEPGTWVGPIVAPPSARRANGGVAIDGTLDVAKKATISASGRGDAWVDTTATRSESHTELRPTGHVGVEAPVGPITLATHAGLVTRPPSFVELFGNRGAFVGNGDLRPESAFTIDLGGHISRRFGPVRLHAEAAGFASWADDLITFVYFGRSQFRTTNVGEARILGVEAQIRASAFGFDLRLTHTALRTSNESLCTADKCPPLPGRPAQDFVGDLSWEGGPVRLRYGVDVVSGITADQKGNIEVPARVLHGASLRVAIPRIRDAWLTLDMRNLFDARVGEYDGVALGASGRPSIVRAPIGDLYDYPLPGRRVLMSARWLLR